VTARTVPGVASPWVAERLAGPSRACTVVADGPHAVYVDVDGDCVGVLAAAAVGVPIGLRTTLERLPDVAGPVEVGDGRIAVEGYDVRPTRIVDPVVPPVGSLPAWRPPVRLDLPVTALRAVADAEASAVLELLGRGDGLTPSGDDVLAGWLVTRHAIGQPAGSVGATVATHAADRTTLLSATLLRRAVVGEALPECRDLLLALRSGIGVEAARDRLLATGHTSGAALALGIGLALGASP
jgi:hypothetical protein